MDLPVARQNTGVAVYYIHGSSSQELVSKAAYATMLDVEKETGMRGVQKHDAIAAFDSLDLLSRGTLRSQQIRPPSPIFGMRIICPLVAQVGLIALSCYGPNATQPQS